MDRGEISDTTFKTITTVGAAFAAYLSILFGEAIDGTKEITLETFKTTSNIISKIMQYTGLSSVYSFLAKIVGLIARVPELIVTSIKNAIVFFYIFCVLILIGQFDWLLNDVYTLTAISLLLTYR